MRHAVPRRTILALVLAALPAYADTLIMRDGQEVSGTLLGATTRRIEFLPVSGGSMKIPVDAVASIRLSQSPVTAPAAPASRAPRATTKKAVIVPAGTAFRVRTIDFIDVDVTQAGAEFRGSIDDPIMIGGTAVVPRGSDAILVVAKVQQGGKIKGSDLIELKVNTICIGSRAYPVVTSVSETKSAGEGKKSAGKILGGAGLGAIIGGIAGGGTGAGIGALVGGAGGTVLAATSQPHLKIPAETRLQFQFASDWKVR